jgi:uncharacterized repeat protein (TIGR03843 family)
VNLQLFQEGEIVVEGRLVDASNATLFVTISLGAESAKGIYKPIAGERPLWDFPDGNLASRERASYLIDQWLGFSHIPLTILRDGPFGPGMVQVWIDIDEDVNLELFFREDDQQLREVALLDAIINNVCDHGVTFHVDDKLRTVLWQWAGQDLRVDEINRLRQLKEFINSPEADELTDLITEAEIEALLHRIARLISDRKFPEPNPEWPHIPWPPF